MWPMKNHGTVPSRLNSTSSRRSDYDQWSQFSETWSNYTYDEYNPEGAPKEDLDDLIHESQLALNVLRNATDSDSCFNFGDPEGSRYGENDYNDSGSVVSDLSRQPSAVPRQPSKKRGSFSSRFGHARMPSFGNRGRGRSPNRPPPAKVSSAHADHYADAQPPLPALQRRGASHHIRKSSNASRRGPPPVSNAQPQPQGRVGNLPRRLSTTRRKQAPVPEPLSPTQEASEGGDDTDFEGCLERLSGSLFTPSDRHTSVERLSASLFTPEDRHTSVNSFSPLLPRGSEEPPVSSTETLRHSTASTRIRSSASSQIQLRGVYPPVKAKTSYELAALQGNALDAPWSDSLPPHIGTQDSHAQHAVTFQNVNLDTMSSAASVVNEKAAPVLLPEDARAPSPPGGADVGADVGADANANENENAYVHGLRLAAVTLALSLSVFVVGIDVNIISTAIPHITQEFNSLDDIGWYGSAFLMTTCAFQVFFGRIYTLFPAKWVFMVSLGIFEAGSLLCALAPNSILFIVGRAIQGVGTSGILSGALIIGSLIVPLSKRSLLGGIVGAMEGVAMISAPLIGGALTDHLTWRWCFYINLPLGAVIAAVVLFVLRIPFDKSSQQQGGLTLPPGLPWWAAAIHVARQLDLLGMALLIPAIITVLLGLQWGGTKYEWSSIGIVLLFVIAAVLFAIFAYFQHQKKELAMIPPRIFKQRTILAGFWFMLCTSSALVVMAYFLPLWFQSILAVSPSNSGLRMLPMLLAVIVAVLLSGAAVSIVGYYVPFMVLGTVLMSIGAAMLSTLSPTTPGALLIVFPAIFGAGIGIAFQQPIIAAQTVLADEDIPVGTSVIVFGQSIGAAIVISVAETVFANRLATNIQNGLGLTVSAASLLNGGINDVIATVTAQGGSMSDLINAENKAITQALYVGLAMASLSIFGAIFIEWKSVKKPGEQPAHVSKEVEAGNIYE